MHPIVFQPLGSPVPAGGGSPRDADVDPRLIRTNYVDGQLLTAEDLTRDQIYLDQRLREAGRILGSGVARGLALSLDLASGRLRLSPGQAVTAAGRVLELRRELEVDLGDRALIASLNGGSFRRLNRALYAVVLGHVEVGSDIAEVFPKDLGAERGFRYGVVTESVQLGLVPLPTALPEQSALAVRARLMRELAGNGPARALVPEDSVALGVIAIRDDRPQWLDPELLREPLRTELSANALASDVARQYERLLTDVLAARQAGGLTGDFAAGEYFSLLPPTGKLPRDGLDPVSGRQAYFPEHFDVTIAPIRRSDVALIQRESMGLPPIDLGSSEPVSVVVLAPLRNVVYGQLALQLERSPAADPRRLPQLDLLRLKLYPTRPVHALDTDAAVWGSIWDRVEDGELIYVRRPTRAPETGISAIVLARGTALPPGQEPTDSAADGGGLLESEDDVRLRWINFDRLSRERPAPNAAGTAAAATLGVEFPGSPELVAACLSALLQIPARYDAVVWETLLALARADALPGFPDALRESDAATALGTRVATIGAGLGIDAGLLARWTELDP
jgi:hypothetical protein